MIPTRLAHSIACLCLLALGWSLRAAEPFRLRWNGLPPSLRAGEPFTATVEALRADGTRAAEVSAPLWVYQVIPRPTPAIVISTMQVAPALVQFAHVGTSPVDLTGWSIHLYDSATNPAPSRAFHVPPQSISLPGDIFRLEILDNPVATVGYPAFRLWPRPNWSAGNPAAVVVMDASSNVVDAVLVDMPRGIITQPVAIAPDWWHGPPVAHTGFSGAWSRVGAVNHRNASDWVRDGLNMFGRANPALVRPFPNVQDLLPVQQISLSNGAWTRSLIVASAAPESRLRVDTHSGQAADTAVLSILPPVDVEIVLPDFILEGAPATTGILRLGQAHPSPLDLELLVSSPNLRIVPSSSISIPAGQTEVPFQVEVPDNTEVTSDITATIEARLADGIAGTLVVRIRDNELPELRWTIAEPLLEGETYEATLSLLGNLANQQTIALAASLPLIEFTPAAANIGGRLTQASVTFRVADDSITNATRQVTLTATTAGLASAETTVEILDDDIHQVRVEIAAARVLAGEPVKAVVRALGEDRRILEHVQETLIPLPPLTLLPANTARLTNGTWSGQITFPAGARIAAPQFKVGDVTGTGALVVVGESSGSTTERPNLTVSITEPQEPVDPSQPWSVQIHVANTGTTTARDVLLRYLLPAGVELASVETDGSQPGDAGGIAIVWEQIAAGSTKTVNIRLLHGHGTAASHRAEVFAANEESSIADNIAIERTAFLAANGPRARVPLNAADMAWDPHRQRLYAVAHDGTQPQGEFLFAINPAIPRPEPVVRVGPAPERIVLSDDGRFAYVVVEGGARVQRVDLAANAVDLTIQPAMPPLDISIVPGAAESLAIVYPAGDGQFFDGAVARPGVTSLFGRTIRPGEEPHVLYAFRVEGILTRLTAVPGQPEIAIGVADAWSGSEPDFRQEAGLVLSPSGILIDGPSLASIGTYMPSQPLEPAVFSQRTAADFSRDRVYLVQQAGWPGGELSGTNATLITFSARDLREVNRQELIDVPGLVHAVIACGTNGVALRTDGGEIILVNPVPGNQLSAADLVVAASPLMGPATLGGIATFSVIVSNAGPAVATDVIIRSVIPLDAEFIDASPTGERVSRQGRVVTFAAGDLTVGESRQFQFRAVTRSVGTLTSHCFALAANPDPNLANNRSASEASSGFSTVLTLNALAAAYDSTQQRLLVAVGASDSSWSNSIVSVPLPDGTMTRVAQLEGEPIAIAVSEDGRFAWVAPGGVREVLRFNLATGTVDQRLNLGAGDGFYPGYVWLVPVPNAPESVLVALPDVTVVFDGSQPRPTTLAPGTPNQVAIADTPGTFFQSGWEGLRRLGIDASGLSVVETIPGGLGGPDFHFATSGPWTAYHAGLLLNLDSGIATPLPTAGLALPDSTRNTLYQLTPSDPLVSRPGYLRAYTLTEVTELWSATLPDLPNSLSQFLPAGPDRAAWVGYGTRLGILDFSRVPTSGTADLFLSAEPASQSLLRGASTAIRLSVRSFGPWRATGATVRVALPPNVTSPGGRWYYGSPEVEGPVVVEGNIATASLPDLLSDNMVYVDLPLTVQETGKHRITVTLTHSGADPSPDEVVLEIEALPWPEVSILDAVVIEGAARATLVLSEPTLTAVNATVAFVPGTAVAGADVTLPPESTVHILPGTRSGFLNLRLVDDAVIEDEEHFSLVITRAEFATIGRSNALITIHDNDAYRFTIRDAPPQSEGNAGTSVMAFQVEIWPPPPAPVSVDYLAAGGTATFGTDHLGSGGRLVFPLGITNLLVNIPIIGDTEMEADESLILSLLNPAGLDLVGFATSTASGIILNDDAIDAPQISGISLLPDRVLVEFPSQSGMAYRLYWTHDLASGEWHAAPAPVIGNGSSMLVEHRDVDTTNSPHTFYRLAIEP